MSKTNKVIIRQPVYNRNTEKNGLDLTFNVVHSDAVVSDSTKTLIEKTCGMFYAFETPMEKSLCYIREKILHIACDYGNQHAIKYILQHYNPDVNCKDLLGFTPLCKAVVKEKNETAEILLNHPNIQVNKSTYVGICKHRKTALHFACENGSDKLVDLLISKGADVNVPDEDNISPLYIASSKGHSNIVRTLLNNGADVTISRIARTREHKNQNESPLHGAVFNCHEDVVEILCEAGANTNRLNSRGQSPLVVACSLRHTGIIKTLLIYGASVNLTDSEGQTPFLYTLGERTLPKLYRQETIKKLESPKKRFHDNNEDISDLKLLQLLINEGANINIMDKFGLTAFDYCIRQGNVSGAAVLVKNGAHCKLNMTDSLNFSFMNEEKSVKFLTLLLHLNTSFRRLVINSVLNFPRTSGARDLVKSTSLSVCSLQEYCRLQIRDHLKHNTHETVLEQLDSLPITETMKRFLSLKDLCNLILQ